MVVGVCSRLLCRTNFLVLSVQLQNTKEFAAPLQLLLMLIVLLPLLPTTAAGAAAANITFSLNRHYIRGTLRGTK